jgi:hypothetical protein
MSDDETDLARIMKNPYRSVWFYLISVFIPDPDWPDPDPKFIRDFAASYSTHKTK